MSRIVLSDVGFHYDDPYAQVFTHLSLALETTWRTAVIGRNGRGKTTLLRLLRGAIRPVSGSIRHALEPVAFPYELPPGVETTRDVLLDAVAPFRRWEREMAVLAERRDEESLARFAEILESYERLGGYDVMARIERELDALGLGGEVLDRAFSTLSGGEQTRALIVPLFLRTDRFPLIDEPTNHLDMEGRERLGDYLARQRGFILVSHDRDLIDRCADHIVAINRADVQVHQTSYSGWRRQMDLTELHEKRRHQNLARQVEALEAAARQRRRWSDAREREKRGAYDKGYVGHLAARQMKRAIAIERRVTANLEAKKALLGNVEKERKLLLRSEDKAPDTLLRVQDLTVTFGARRVLDRVSLRVRPGDRIAVIGPNGCGKTTLLRAVAGERRPDEGLVDLPRHVVVERAFQQPIWSSGDLRAHLRDAELDETHFRRVMGSLGVDGSVFDRPLETFSLGERKKVDLCRAFVRSAHLLIWDEPMNYIDLVSREQIEEAILRGTPTMLFVEHDRRFIERIATDVVELG